jgi:hypothetical protein
MKRWILFLSLAICILGSGCVKNVGWKRSDGQPIDQVQFNKDREECNRGWAVYMTADILLTAGLLSVIHYAEAKRCMTIKGYIKEMVENVFVAPRGKYYHLRNCQHISQIPNQYLKEMTSAEAEALGYGRCPSCFPDFPKSK